VVIQVIELHTCKALLHFSFVYFGPSLNSTEEILFTDVATMTQKQQKMAKMLNLDVKNFSNFLNAFSVASLDRIDVPLKYK
jgi:hypothetical protein